MKTQIICTIGPASENEETLKRLLDHGMTIARLNFSHATYDQLRQIKKIIDDYNAGHQTNVKLLMDLQGPRMRVGVLPPEGIDLKEGQKVSFTTDPDLAHAIHIDDPYLHEDIMVDHPLFLANGDIELNVIEKKGSEIVAEVVRGGTLHSRKGVNVPETKLTTTGLTEKDIKDLQMGLEIGIDCIAVSFVKDRNDIDKTRSLLQNKPVAIWAKIESKQALVHLDEIIDAADGIMVARGDLGIEIPLEDIPFIQKDMIKKAREKGKPAIVATHMLLSMINHYRPTRAETTDVANAVLDGAWGVMLSEESASGKYPVEAVEYMTKMVKKAEEYKTS